MKQAWIEFLPSFIRTRIDGQKDIHRVISNVSWLFADRILNLIFGLIIGIWVARYLGPEQYGLFNYIFAFVALFGPLSALGLDAIVVRDIVNDPACKEDTLGTAFILKLAGGILTLLAAVGIVVLIRPLEEPIHLFVAIVSLGTIFKSLDVIDLWFQSQAQVKYIVIARNSALLIAAAIKIYFLAIQASLLAFIWAAFAEIILISVGFLLTYMLTGGKIRLWRIRAARAWQLIHDCWPLAISSIAIVLYMKLDLVIIGGMLDSRAVGIYAAAARLSEVWYFVPIAIMTAAAPSIIQAKKINQALYYRKIQNTFKLMSFLSLIVILPTLFLSQKLIFYLYGNEYLQAATILNIHIFSSIFVFLGVAQGTWDVAEGLTKNALQRTLWGAIINIILNIILIPIYGGIGSAIATVVAYAFSASILNLLSEKTRGIFLIQMRSLLFFW